MNAVPAQQYDAIIIGAGQSGQPLAHALSQAGWKTAIIERKYVGGTCINYGCTPTKTMIASAGVAHLARRAAEYGVLTGEVTIDFKKVMARKNGIVEKFRQGIEQGIEKAENLTLMYGEARFAGNKLLEVNLTEGGTVRLTAGKIFIDTGVSPRAPKFEGIEKIEWLDSTAILAIDTVPEHLLIIGGGYIALEYGQMFRRFGSRVSIFERGGQLLKNEDEDIAKEVKKILEEEGIDVYLQTEITKVSGEMPGEIELQVATSAKVQVIKGSHLLSAMGSTPNTAQLNLEVTQVQTDDKGYIVVNDKLETTQAGIYAMGDVKGGPAFTHISYDDFRILKMNLLDNHSTTITHRQLPYTVFTDPQLARIGLNEKQAAAKGIPIKKATYPMASVARAIETGQTKGFMKVLIDASTGQIAGASIIGMDSGEIMAMLQIAMMGKLSYTHLQNAIFAHPTLAESLNLLFNNID